MLPLIMFSLCAECQNQCGFFFFIYLRFNPAPVFSIMLQYRYPVTCGTNQIPPILPKPLGPSAGASRASPASDGSPNYCIVVYTYSVDFFPNIIHR